MADSGNVVVGASGKVWIANAADVMAYPDDISTPLDAAFADVGFVSEDGVTFTDTKNIADVNAWQSFYPIRKIVTDKASSIAFIMREWTAESVITAFGGGAISTDTGVSVYTPPSPGELTQIAVCVEWSDGANDFRLIMPVGIVASEVSTQLVRTAAADLPVTIDATPAGTPDSGDLGTQPWYLVTDDGSIGS